MKSLLILLYSTCVNKKHSKVKGLLTTTKVVLFYRDARENKNKLALTLSLSPKPYPVLSAPAPAEQGKQSANGNSHPHTYTQHVCEENGSSKGWTHFPPYLTNTPKSVRTRVRTHSQHFIELTNQYSCVCVGLKKQPSKGYPHPYQPVLRYCGYP